MNFYPYNHNSVVARDEDLCVIRHSSGHLCGYCAFPEGELPKEWHGDYSADALQYLQIHGGLTYCNVQGGNEEARLAAIKAARESITRPSDSASLDERMEYYRKRDAAADEAAKTEKYTHVVFGFDCAHAGDEGKAELIDPTHVLDLARQMREQISVYASVLHEWRAAGRETRIAIIEQIREKAAHKSDFGFGAMIGMLSGASVFGEDGRIR